MAETISWIVRRPLLFFILSTIAVTLVSASIVFSYWYNLMEKIEQSVDKKIQAKAYELAVPCTDLVRNVIKSQMRATLTLLALMLVVTVSIVFALMVLILKKMEKTTQAETSKRMKQSSTFANVNHDIRGYLACIKGWIELSYHDVAPTSHLASNLKKMEDCANDLLGLVNSILDVSKIEAGKMQLEEREFDLAQLLEDVADLHYPMAMKKGVEVILDPCDGSIMNFSKVIGDQAKLKQILTNLLSNAVKFTSQGHISIRAKAKKLDRLSPDHQSSNVAAQSSRRSYNLLNQLCRFISWNKRACNSLDETQSIKEELNCMEFVFEVEDTGPGIPEDKRNSIFENFVQVKENSATAGEIGTGLGLSIVQSLVRLMGGDIEIVDRANGDTGTCFRFNIFLTSSLACINQDTNLSSGRSTAKEGSLAVLLIKNDERRRMVRRYMNSLGINLVTLRQGNQLHSTLERIKSELKSSQRNLSRFTAVESATDDIAPVKNKRRSDARRTSSMKCILLIIDANAGDFDRELSRSVAHFRKGVSRACVKVVWLDRNETHRAHFHGLQEDSLPPTDHIILEPFHGSRLTRVVSLLPELGGLLPNTTRSSSSTISSISPQSDFGEIASSQRQRIDKGEIASHLVNPSTAEVLSQDLRYADKKPSVAVLEQRSEVGASSEKPLQGKRFLIAEDNPMQSKLAVTCVTRWGADDVEVCQNGKEAFEVVCKALSDIPSEGLSKVPFDYILMDCQMPVMDGMQATRRIREEEHKYGVRIPIIALTAHATTEEREKIHEAGMNGYLTKPLNIEKLLQIMDAPMN